MNTTTDFGRLIATDTEADLGPATPTQWATSAISKGSFDMRGRGVCVTGGPAAAIWRHTGEVVTRVSGVTTLIAEDIPNREAATRALVSAGIPVDAWITSGWNLAAPIRYPQGAEMTATAAYTLTATDVRDAGYASEIHTQAQAENASVRYWDAQSEPTNPGWVLRTYSTDEAGNSSWTDEAE